MCDTFIIVIIKYDILYIIRWVNFIYIYILFSFIYHISFAKKKINLFSPNFITVIYFKYCSGLKNRLHLNAKHNFFWFLG